MFKQINDNDVKMGKILITVFFLKPLKYISIELPISTIKLNRLKTV